MIWYDMIWYDMIWYDTIRYDTIWYDMIIYDLMILCYIILRMIRYHMILYDITRYDITWYDNICHLRRLVPFVVPWHLRRHSHAAGANNRVAQPWHPLVDHLCSAPVDQRAGGRREARKGGRHCAAKFTFATVGVGILSPNNPHIGQIRKIMI